jgi:hypothetical protein
MTNKKLYGYLHFKAVGEQIKQRTTVDYQKKDIQELVELEKRAVRWLKDNRDHPKFPEALKRYEKIKDTLVQKNSEDIFLK